MENWSINFWGGWIKLFTNAELNPMISISWIQLMGHTSAGLGVKWHGSGRVCLVTGHTSSLRGPSPLALTFLGGVMFISWRLRRPYLEECQWGPRHFWSGRAHLGYSPVPGPILDKYRWIKSPCFFFSFSLI